MPRISPSAFRRSLLSARPTVTRVVAPRAPVVAPTPMFSTLAPSPLLLRGLLPRSPALLTSTVSQQVRHKTYGNEYQPSQLKRKRKHGFLNRKRSRTGRKVLFRRAQKGRKYLSH